jgi:hypothetical protein
MVQRVGRVQKLLDGLSSSRPPVSTGQWNFFTVFLRGDTFKILQCLGWDELLSL